MRKFAEVEKFASKTTTTTQIVDAMIKFAENTMLDGAGKPFPSKTTLAEQSKIINGMYKDLVTKMGAYDAEKHQDLETFATLTTTQELAQVVDKMLLNAIYPTVFNTPFFNTVCQMHFEGYGDTFQIDLKNNKLYNVSRFGRRQKHTMTQTRENASRTITTQSYGITTITNLPQILLGEAMIADELMVCALSMQAKIYKLALAKFKAETDKIVIPAFLASGAFNEKTWLQKLKNVKAYSGNTAPIIVGDPIALKTLLPTAQTTRINLQDPYNTTVGYMDRWNTYGVMAFEAVADDDGNYGILGLDEDKLYAFAPSGNKYIHIAVGKTMINSDGEYDNMNLSKLTTVRQEIGLELITNDVLAVNKLA